jgi:hypothetical protein
LYSKGLGEEIREDALAPGYFFYGEESYFADLFIRELVSLLAPGDAPDFQIDRYYLDETGWGEIIDTARTMPFLFSPWRVIVVRAPERKPDADKGGEKEAKLVSEADEKLLKRYFADPSSRTALVIILPGKLRKGNAAVRVLSSLPGIVAKDAKPLRDWNIGKWVTEKARSLGKALAPNAVLRLIDIVGNDLRRLDNELEKLAVFVDEEKPGSGISPLTSSTTLWRRATSANAFSHSTACSRRGRSRSRSSRGYRGSSGTFSRPRSGWRKRAGTGRRSSRRSTRGSRSPTAAFISASLPSSFPSSKAFRGLTSAGSSRG